MIRKLKLSNRLELKIFFTIYQHPKGISRDDLALELLIPRTTIYDNLIKLMKKEINNIPYIKYYCKNNGLKGRPTKLFYIPKGLKTNFTNFIIN